MKNYYFEAQTNYKSFLDEGTTADSSSPVDPHSDLFAVLEGSALIPFLEARLRANSFLEICRHSNVYKCVINIIKEIGLPSIFINQKNLILRLN